jgi:hypothetical protein
MIWVGGLGCRKEEEEGESKWSNKLSLRSLRRAALLFRSSFWALGWLRRVDSSSIAQHSTAYPSSTHHHLPKTTTFSPTTPTHPADNNNPPPTAIPTIASPSPYRHLHSTTRIFNWNREIESLYACSRLSSLA